MKKYQISLLAMTTLLLACNPKQSVGDVDNNALVGKWKLTTLDGKPVLTDNRVVLTFDATGKGTQTLSKDLENVGEKAWYMQQKLKYTLNGNALHTQWTNSTVVLEWLASIQSINSNEFTTDRSRVLLQTAPVEDMAPSVWQRIYADYENDIVGMWEGTSCSGITYGDHNHRWLYLPSGRYYYYNMDSTKWEWYISENALNEYDVDGDYLACRWKVTEESNEDREFWDIQIHNKDMRWDALRENANTHEQFNANFTMRRVSPTSQEVDQFLPGKWIAVEEDGKPIVTNRKSVHTFDGNGMVSYTIADTTQSLEWNNHLELNYTNMGAYLIEKGWDNNHQMVEWRSSLVEMDMNSLLVYAFSSSRATEEYAPYRIIRLKKVNVNYQDAILGMWEGISGGGSHGGHNQRWEYLPIGEDGVYHYNYYDKVGDQWVLSTNNDGEYVVDGNYLVTRWTDNTSHRRQYENWDIEIQGDTMYWTGLRINGDTDTFTMVRVQP